MITFSNRCFPTKAVRAWLQRDDFGHAALVAGYLNAARNWTGIEHLDRSPRAGDPLHAIVRPPRFLRCCWTAAPVSWTPSNWPGHSRFRARTAEPQRPEIDWRDGARSSVRTAVSGPQDHRDSRVTGSLNDGRRYARGSHTVMGQLPRLCQAK